MKGNIYHNFKVNGIMLLAIIIVLIGSSSAFSKENTPYRIQALFLYNFTKHITWDVNKKSNFIIGVTGDSQTISELQKNLKDKFVWGNKIELVTINSPADLDNCHTIFIAKSCKKKILDVIKASDFSNKLIVTENNYASKQACIQFFYQDSKLKFRINEDKIEESGLFVSEQLLSMATH